MSTDSSPAQSTAMAQPPAATRLIAPWWHTVLLILILIGASAGQAHTLGAIVARHGRMPLYISSMAIEWVLVAFIWLAVRARGMKFRELVGGRWQRPEDALLDLALAGAAWITFAIIAGALAYALHMAEPQKIREMRRGIEFLVPHSGLETAVWIGLSVTAGFCEEIIFRGYFQRQFALASGSVIAGVVLQAIIFGGGHGYEGWQRMLIIAVMGIVLGSLAAWRKSLRPGMIMHTWQDLLAGIASRFVSG